MENSSQISQNESDKFKNREGLAAAQNEDDSTFLNQESLPHELSQEDVKDDQDESGNNEWDAREDENHKFSEKN